MQCKYCGKHFSTHASMRQILDMYWYQNNMNPSDHDHNTNLSYRKKSYAKYLQITRSNSVPLCMEAEIKIQFSMDSTVFTDGSTIKKWYNVRGKVHGGRTCYTP